MLVGRELTKLQQEFPKLQIKKVDILTNPGRTLKDGVKMIPTLKAGDKTLSGIFLSSAQVREFVTETLTSTTPT
jgi:hypothetical protein